jgi:CRISPR system Cascade subunit CasC
MQRFIQVHLLTAYPPSNPNRDESGKPKTAKVGGVERLRLSSQSIKRAVRTSEVFSAAVEGKLGVRTQRIGERVQEHLLSRNATPEMALAAARAVAKMFGKVKPEGAQTEQLVFVTPEEWQAALSLGEDLASGKVPMPVEDEEEDAVEGADKDKKKAAKKKKAAGPKLPEIRRTAAHAVDVALFGRMLADAPKFNFEAAANIAHAFSTHRVQADADYYSAVDDLRDKNESLGSSFIGDAGYGSAVHYIYACINTDVLLRNLGRDTPGSEEIAATAVKALISALATESPNGKRASFAHNPRASVVMVEIGAAQPRTLASAFIRPVESPNILGASAKALVTACQDMDVAYGPCAEDRVIMIVGEDAQPRGVERFDITRVRSLVEAADFAVRS